MMRERVYPTHAFLMSMHTNGNVVLCFGECDSCGCCRAHNLEDLRRRVEETQSLF